MENNIFEKIQKATDEELQKLLQKINYDELAASIVESSRELKEKIFKNMTTNGVSELFEKTEELLKKGQGEIDQLKNKAIKLIDDFLK